VAIASSIGGAVRAQKTEGPCAKGAGGGRSVAIASSIDGDVGA